MKPRPGDAIEVLFFSLIGVIGFIDLAAKVKHWCKSNTDAIAGIESYNMRIEDFEIEYYGCNIEKKLSINRNDIPKIIGYKYIFLVKHPPEYFRELLNNNLYSIISQSDNLEIIKFICTIDKSKKTIDVHYAIETNKAEKEAFLKS